MIFAITGSNALSSQLESGPLWVRTVPVGVASYPGQFALSEFTAEKANWQVTSHLKTRGTTGNEAAVGENDMKWLIFWTADKDIEIGLIRFHG